VTVNTTTTDDTEDASSPIIKQDEKINLKGISFAIISNLCFSMVGPIVKIIMI
jgi:hypothetical protein